MEGLKWKEMQNFHKTKCICFENKQGHIMIFLDDRKLVSLDCYIYRTMAEMDFDLRGEDADKFIEMLKKFIECYESA
jgi:hypothetical protein